MRSNVIPILVILFCCPSLPARGVPVTNVLSASKDNTLYSLSSQVTTTNSNGLGSYFFTGNNNDNPPSKRRGLLFFDIAGSLPAGATIRSVTLSLNMDRSKNSTDPTSLHRATTSWGEGTSNADQDEGRGALATPGDATWFHRFYSTSVWASAGGDFLSTTSAITSVGNTAVYTWSSSQMVADVQFWLDNPSSNFGWLVRGNEAVKQTATRFGSRNHTDANKRPKLTVAYDPPAAVGSCCFANGDCLTLSSSECALLGGTYGGDGTACAPNPCPQPEVFGACCITNGSCVYTTDTACAEMGGSFQGANIPCADGLCPVVLTPFVDALPIPPIAMPVEGGSGGTGHYVMAIQEFGQKLHRDLPTTTVWGVNGSYPGPTFLATRGLPVTVLWSNDLRDSTGTFRTNHYLAVDHCLHGPHLEGDTARTVIHLHGGKVAPESDGYPEDTLLPGESDLYYYPNDQRGASTWYHDHALGITRLNVYMGVAGGYVIFDPAEAGLALPSGAYDVPLILQDRSFYPDGSLSYPEMWHEHFFGDHAVVNGKVTPFLSVNRGKYRFRLFNGCTSRTLQLGLTTNAPMWLIAGDGGLLDAPIATNRVLISPGERYEVIVDFSPFTAGTSILLTNDAPTAYPSGTDVGITNFMKFIVGGTLGHTQAVPAVLATNVPLSTSLAVVTNDFVLKKYSDPCAGTRWLINGLLWDDITEFPELDTVEVWRFINQSGVVHPMHLHLVFFQVLDRQNFVVSNEVVVPVGPALPPGPDEAGWKDTVRAMPDQITRVIARFEGHTGKYPYHCHILEHEDHEMMRQFQVVITRAPELLPPTDVSTNRFVLHWTPVLTATNTLLDVSTDPLFAAGTFVPGYSNRSLGVSASWEVSALNPGTWYYYRLRSQNPGRTSTNSVTGSVFTVPLHTFLVESVRGNPAPSGATVHVDGATITARVDAVVAAGTTQYWSAGWSMIGNEPFTGSSNQVVLVLTNDATLTWRWTTNYWLEATAGPYGTVSLSNGWFASGSIAPITAVASNYYRFSRWTGDVLLSSATNNPLDLLMDSAKGVLAEFAARLATNGAPEWWLASYYPDTVDFDQAALSDTDMDGAEAWEEYIAGTVPTNGTSVLRFGEVGAYGNVVTWPSVSGRTYRLGFATNIYGSFVYESFPDALNLPATPTLNAYTNTTVTNAPVLMYRLDVRNE